MSFPCNLLLILIWWNLTSVKLRTTHKRINSDDESHGAGNGDVDDDNADGDDIDNECESDDIGGVNTKGRVGMMVVIMEVMMTIIMILR